MLNPLQPLGISESELARLAALGKFAGAGDAAPLPPQTPPTTPPKGPGLGDVARKVTCWVAGYEPRRLLWSEMAAHVVLWRRIRLTLAYGASRVMFIFAAARLTAGARANEVECRHLGDTRAVMPHDERRK
jgi:hypothetical protein